MTNALANRQGALNPLKAADPKDVLLRVLNEESTKDIALSFGVTRSALNQWLLDTAETEWKAAQVARAYRRKEEAEDELDTAADSLSLARAREKLRAAQWDLERVCRRIYGQDAPPQGVNAVQININLRRSADGTAQDAAQVIDVKANGD
jgi:F0F1-type ATP synthase epsilon subunit